MIAGSLLRHRDTVAMLPALVVLALLATASVKQIVKLKDTSEAITISLYEEPPAQEPPPPPRPERRVAPPEPAPPRPQPVPMTMPAPAPVATQSAQPVAAPAASASPATPAASAPVAAPATAPATPPPRSAENVEASYVAKLRSYLNSIKRYPTSREARQQHPQGKVRIWLDLARDGTLRALGIEESSGSMILDGAAQSTVRQGTFPAFPDDTFAGAATHRFAVTLEYTLEG